GAIAHARDLDAQPIAVAGPEPLEVALDAGAREIVQHEHGPAFPQETLGEVGADEATATGDQDVSAHTVSPRPASSAAASATRSDATCPGSHAASSRRPSSKATCGA